MQIHMQNILNILKTSGVLSSPPWQRSQLFMVQPMPLLDDWWTGCSLICKLKYCSSSHLNFVGMTPIYGAHVSSHPSTMYTLFPPHLYYVVICYQHTYNWTVFQLTTTQHCYNLSPRAFGTKKSLTTCCEL